ncbi:MAG: DUF2281 domain-containing protein [Geobacteraceae bacterium]|nr:DUF2281 domain-containing protein [Geobacteraceae bacterium]
MKADAGSEVNLNLLPENARQELLDFYQFLLTRYRAKPTVNRKRFQALLNKPLRVERIEIPCRESLYER